MNVGDTFHGGAEALFTNGNAIVEATNALSIDIGVPGNWDYAYGPIVTNARFGQLENAQVQRPNYPMLAANATYRIPPAMATNPLASTLVQSVFNFTAGEPFLPAIKMIQRSGVNIGFIGLTSDIVEFMHPTMAFNIDFISGLDNYQQLIEEQASLLRSQGANLVVVMSELGLQKDWALANNIAKDTVDIIFSAHTHEVTPEPLVSKNGTLVVESGNDSYLGQMDITFEGNKVVNKAWQLHTLDDTVIDDVEMFALVEKIRAPFLVENPNITAPTVTLSNDFVNSQMPTTVAPTLTASLNKVFSTSQLPLTRRNSLENNFNNWFTDRLKSDHHTDIAITSGFRFDAVIIPSKEQFQGDSSDYIWQSETPEILNGDISVKDAYRFFPAPFYIAQGQVSVARLKEIIESNLESVYSPSAFEQKGGWVDGFSGLTLALDLNANAGERIQSLMLTENDSIPNDNTIISVTGCARPFDLNAATTLCAYDGFENVTNLINPQTNQAYIAVDYFIDTLTKQAIASPIDKLRQSISDDANLEQWPIAPYYQKLE